MAIFTPGSGVKCAPPRPRRHTARGMARVSAGSPNGPGGAPGSGLARSTTHADASLKTTGDSDDSTCCGTSRPACIFPLAGGPGRGPDGLRLHAGRDRQRHHGHDLLQPDVDHDDVDRRPLHGQRRRAAKPAHGARCVHRPGDAASHASGFSRRHDRLQLHVQQGQPGLRHADDLVHGTRRRRRHGHARGRPGVLLHRHQLRRHVDVHQRQLELGGQRVERRDLVGEGVGRHAGRAVRRHQLRRQHADLDGRHAQPRVVELQRRDLVVPDLGSGRRRHLEPADHVRDRQRHAQRLCRLAGLLGHHRQGLEQRQVRVRQHRRAADPDGLVRQRRPDEERRRLHQLLPHHRAGRQRHHPADQLGAADAQRGLADVHPGQPGRQRQHRLRRRQHRQPVGPEHQRHVRLHGDGHRPDDRLLRQHASTSSASR